MISTELATRILLTVIIVGAFTINHSRASSTGTSATTTDSSSSSLSSATNEQSQSDKSKTGSKVNVVDEQSSSLDSPVAVSSSSPTSLESEGRSFPFTDDDAETRLWSNSAEAGILLPYDEDFPKPGGDTPRGFSYGTDMLPASIAFPAKPIGLRITNGKALEQPRESHYGMDPGQAFKEDLKRTPTYFIRNSCFGPRCLQQQSNNKNNEHDFYFSKKEGKAKKYDGGSRSNNYLSASTKYEDNVMESMSSNFHSQLAIPFMVVDDNSMKGNSLQSTYSKRSGFPLGADRFSRMTTTISPSTEGWVKLKAISPDTYDPFRVTKNNSLKGINFQQAKFNKRDSSLSASNQLSKRVGVELNPESFADRWGWNEDQDRRGGGNGGGSRLPAWLEDQLKYGNRNSDQDKNWVKLEPIPVAGVTISKWVPKGTPVSNLPTTNWQTNRDRPNGGSPWWDRIDDNRILTGSRPSSPSFLRPGSNDDDGRYNGGSGGGWGSGSSSKGSSLSTFDRYPTNSWNDIIYPEGPQSATVSWQQSKGVSNRPSSFPTGGSGGGWSSESDRRHPTVATGSWSAPPNRRYPSNNRYNDHRSTSYPTKQAAEEDPRWVLISNTRRVTSGSSGPPNYNRGNDLLDRSKILSYINRLHPDLDRRGDFPFYDSSSSSSSHRHGKDYWPSYLGGLSTSTVVVSPNKDDAFHMVNATLSSLTPVLIHRSGAAMSQQVGDSGSSSSQNQPSRLEGSAFEGDNDDGSSSITNSNANKDIVISSSMPPMLSTYFGDGRATSNAAAAFLQQSSTSTPFRNRNNIPGRIRQGLRNINPVYAAVGAGMIPATLAAVMPMMLGRRRKRRDISNLISHRRSLNYFPYFLLSNMLYSNYDNTKKDSIK